MRYHSGFTLIELIVVVGIIAVLTAGSMAAFNTYSQRQTLFNAVLDMRAMLQLARSRALSQVKTNNCNNKSLDGYQVLICYGINPACSTSNHYEIDVSCNSTLYKIDSKTLPNSVNVANTTTSKSFFFNSLTGAVGGSGRIDLKSSGQPVQSITVQTTGVIQ